MTTQRPFNASTDVVLIRDFLTRMVGAHGQHRFLHTGDWLWQLHLRDDRLEQAESDLRIWCDSGGAIIGFVWLIPPSRVEMQVDPTVSPTGEIETEMLAWARERQRASSDGGSAPIEIEAYEHDSRKVRFLEAHGFRNTGEDRMNLFVQALDNRPYVPAVPSGAVVGAVDIRTDLKDRIAIHREVWHPSKMTATSYQRVRAAPGYLPDLDLIAVAPAGEIAAYATVWYDPVNRIGEFEPVGARETFRRQGYALAVMIEGLRRLQTLGAREAIVFSLATNDASNGLYTRSGFHLDGQFHGFRRDD